MRWSSGAVCGIHHSTTIMITNTNDNVREDVVSTGPVTVAVSAGEVFFGIDAADVRQVVTQIVAGESPKPAQGMTKETLLKQVARRLKAGFRVRWVTARHAAVPWLCVIAYPRNGGSLVCCRS